MAAVQTVRVKGVPVVRLNGRFPGGEETDDLDRALGLLDAEGARGAVINLKNAAYLATIALGTLVKCHMRFTKRGARVVLCEVDHKLWQVFVIMKLCLLFESFPTEAEAVEALLGRDGAQETERELSGGAT
jgi:anti-anti-sigma factor